MEQSKPVSLADLDLGRWSAEDGRAFEVAEWVMGALIAWCSAESARERAEGHPDPARLAELASETDGYAAVQRELSIREPERVQEVLAEYGPLARARFGN